MKIMILASVAAFFLAVGSASAVHPVGEPSRPPSALASAAGAAAPRTHTVVVGEHLWALAGRYYSNHFLWRRLEEANRAIIKYPHWIYPGQVLIIPDEDQLPPEPEPEASSFLPPAPAPVETAAPVPATAPEPPPAPPPPPAPKPRPRPHSVKFAEEMPESLDETTLSSEIPGGMTSSPGDQPRVAYPKGWQPQGEVLDTDGMDTFAIAGQVFEAQLSPSLPVSQGDRFVILRRSARPERVADTGRVYLQRVGEASAREALGKGKRRFIVLRAAGVVQSSDLLQRAGEPGGDNR